jgi:hypothetical protein
MPIFRFSLLEIVMIGKLIDALAGQTCCTLSVLAVELGAAAVLLVILVVGEEGAVVLWLMRRYRHFCCPMFFMYKRERAGLVVVVEAPEPMGILAMLAL